MKTMLISSLFVLVFAIVCHCQKTTDLLLYPIEQTPYMVYVNKKTTEKPVLTIKEETVQFDGKSFLNKLKDEQHLFVKGEQIGDSLVKAAPPLLTHPTFCVRKIDSEEGNIQIVFNWEKELLSSTRTYSYLFQMKLYNFRGDFLENLEFKKNSEENNAITIKMKSAPMTEGQRYTNEAAFDAHDLLVVIIRTISGQETSPWSFHITYPTGLINLNIGGKSIANQNDWTLEEILKQQSGFQGLSMLEDDQNYWQMHSFKFALFNWFTRVAALPQSQYDEDKYLSRIQIPKSDETGNYGIKTVAQRTGAGFGLLYWDKEGYHFSEKFVENFVDVEGNRINNGLLKSFVETCFDYGQLLDARTKKEKETELEANYRNKVGNDNWTYTISSKKLTGERAMIGEVVSEISWNFNSNKWTTNADGIVQNEKKSENK